MASCDRASRAHGAGKSRRKTRTNRTRPIKIMPEQTAIFIAARTGFVSGLLLSMPVGPVNLTIINEGARRGFVWAALIGLGASAMDVIYCTIAFTGFSSFFGSRMVKTSMEVFSFAFMLF